MSEEKEKGWAVYQVDEETVHVIPKNDLILHEDGECVCSPKIGIVRTEARDYIKYEHSALDGRG